MPVRRTWADRAVSRVAATGFLVAATLFAPLALLSTNAAAQDSALVAGSRIRIQSADEKQVNLGTFRNLSADSLTYSPGLDTSRVTIPLSRVGKIEVSRSRSSVGSVLRDGAIGAGLGLGATLALSGGCALLRKSDCFLGPIVASPFIVGGGFLIGALIGAGDHKEGWSRAYPPERRTSLIVGPAPRGGFVLGLSVAFGSAPAN